MGGLQTQHEPSSTAKQREGQVQPNGGGNDIAATAWAEMGKRRDTFKVEPVGVDARGGGKENDLPRSSNSNGNGNSGGIGGGGWGRSNGEKEKESGRFEVEVDDDEQGVGGVGRATVLLLGESPFASSVTKTFRCAPCGASSSLMIRVPRFRVVIKHRTSSGGGWENGVLTGGSEAGGRNSSNDSSSSWYSSSSSSSSFDSRPHAEYLVVVSAGAVTFGVWRRFTHFQRLAESIGLGTGGGEVAQQQQRAKCEKEAALADQFRMTHFSWAVLGRRKKLFRCLERDYLVVKCFLLERFLHDLVFESTSPQTIRDFLGVW
jgi:hypothetical protein